MLKLISFSVKLLERLLKPWPEAAANLNFKSYNIRASELTHSIDEDDDYRPLEVFECTIPVDPPVVIKTTDVHYNVQSLVSHWLENEQNASSPAAAWLRLHAFKLEQSRKFWVLKHRLTRWSEAVEKTRVAKEDELSIRARTISALKDLL